MGDTLYFIKRCLNVFIVSLLFAHSLTQFVHFFRFTLILVLSDVLIFDFVFKFSWPFRSSRTTTTTTTTATTMIEYHACACMCVWMGVCDFSLTIPLVPKVHPLNLFPNRVKHPHYQLNQIKIIITITTTTAAPIHFPALPHPPKWVKSLLFRSAM